MMRFFKLWLPVFFWCGFIFYLSGIQGLATPWGIWDFILRKCAHASEYFILTFLLYRAFKGSFNLSRVYLILLPSFFSLLYAISDEFHQSFIPTRGPSPWDISIDAAGIIFFYIFIRLIKKYSK